MWASFSETRAYLRPLLAPRNSLAADEVGERLPLAHQVGFAVLDQHFDG
jgi:hypothetical protein